ncbi:hypothetical protein SDC9_98825 [bioreactor metagenome]|uniref:Uncharacterized protein n=1 Tax=bioreactor metagenome TaxID=1076179 RepID=A0A645AFT3_9ZZZZ
MNVGGNTVVRDPQDIEPGCGGIIGVGFDFAGEFLQHFAGGSLLAHFTGDDRIGEKCRAVAPGGDGEVRRPGRHQTEVGQLDDGAFRRAVTREYGPMNVSAEHDGMAFGQQLEQLRAFFRPVFRTVENDVGIAPGTGNDREMGQKEDVTRVRMRRQRRCDELEVGLHAVEENIEVAVVHQRVVGGSGRVAGLLNGPIQIGQHHRVVARLRAFAADVMVAFERVERAGQILPEYRQRIPAGLFLQRPTAAVALNHVAEMDCESHILPGPAARRAEHLRYALPPAIQIPVEFLSARGGQIFRSGSNLRRVVVGIAEHHHLIRQRLNAPHCNHCRQPPHPQYFATAFPVRPGSMNRRYSNLRIPIYPAFPNKSRSGSKNHRPPMVSLAERYFNDVKIRRLTGMPSVRIRQCSGL